MAKTAVIIAAALAAISPPRLAQLAKQQRQQLERIEPYRGWTAVGGVERYAIPAQIVECESHGDVDERSHPYGSSGLYQIELSVWREFGGRVFALFPYLATKWQQSIIAHRIWTEVGARAWTCSYITGWL